MSTLKLFLRTIDTINEWTGRIVAWLVLPLVFIAMLEVILRYGFNRPTTWAWDINEWLMAGLTILMGGYILLKDGHVTVDIVVRQLSPRARAIIDLVTSVVFFISVGALLWGGTSQAWESFLTREESGNIFRGPIYVIKMAWPPGVFLLLLQGVGKFIRDLMTVIQPKGGKN
jgi:TRAP-type mannitol/chloroaromatic compound transport system permease small subunit